jgi:hypothetical protein
MAYTEEATCVTLIAGADLRTHQFKFVSVAADGEVELTADDAKAQGVLMNAPNTGEAATVAIGGIVKVECGDTVTRGGDVASGANGEAKDAGTASTVLGTALETGADGRVISILLGR